MFERVEEMGFGARAPGRRNRREWPEHNVAIDGRHQDRSSTASPVDATPHVFVLDHDHATRRSIAAMLRGSGCSIEGHASASEFLARPCATGPSCLILGMARDQENLDLQKHLATERPDMPIIIVAGAIDVPTCAEAMKTGALDFLLKPLDTDSFRDSVANAIEHSRTAVREAAELTDLHKRHASLSPREHQVMQLVVSGLPNKLISDRLGISEITVKAHRGKVMHKMRARSLANLTVIAMRLG